MKRLNLGLAVTIALALAVLVPVAQATEIQVGSLITLNWWDTTKINQWGGGAFTVHQVGGPPPTHFADFQTFCVDRHVYITLGTTYYVSSVTALHTTDVGALSGTDGAQAGWLFANYGITTLNPDGTGVMSKQEMEGFQFAIWKLTGNDYSGLPGSGLVRDAYDDYLALAASHTADTSDFYGTRILLLNLHDEFGVPAQAQLILTGGGTVPEPGSLILLGLGLSAIGFALRKRS